MKDIGKHAEDIAVSFLKKAGYYILERNFYSHYGEIDIIARDSEYLVFVEVKCRKSDSFGGAISAVDKRKQEKIKKTAMSYLQKKHISSAVRFDVVLLKSENKKVSKKEIEIIKNAFW